MSDDWPPNAPVTLTSVIPAYLYQQYSDDEDLQAFVDSYNVFAQDYVTWFATVPLPVFTNLAIEGTLLDWVAEGLYGFARPLLPSTFLTQDIGIYNTFIFNELVYNGYQHIGPDQFYSVNDDVFRRILIWHLWKGDGKLFDIRWLKRRIKRFLSGDDGSSGQTDETYDVSVTFGAGNQVNINFLSIHWVIGTGFGAYNTTEYNVLDYNGLEGVETFYTPLPVYVEVFKAAVIAGVLELPFQYEFIVNIN